MAHADSALTKIQMSALTAALFCACFFTPSLCAFGADSVADAYKLYQGKRYKEAAQMFEGCLNTQRPNANVCYYAAVCNQEAGNLARAKVLYKQVVQLSPGSTIAVYSQNILVKLDPSAQRSAAGSPFNPGGQNSPSAAEGTVSGPDEGAVYYKDYRNEIWVPVEINNRSIEMVLDTGAPGITLGKNQLERIGIRPPEGKAAGKSGGASNDSTQDFWEMNATVRVGPFSIAGSKLHVLATNESSPLLGQGFLQHFDYTVDQSAKCIRLRRKGHSVSTSSKSGQFIPFVFQEEGNRIIVEVELNGRKGPMILDTGNAASGVAFNSVAQAKQYGAAPPADAVTKRHGGVSGSGRALEYTATRVKLGPIDRSNVEVSANLDTPNDNEPPLLGHEFFDGWQYNVDLKERKIWLLRR